MAEVILNKTRSGPLCSVYFHARISFLYMVARTGTIPVSSLGPREWLVKELSRLRNFGDCRIAYILKGLIFGALPTKEASRADHPYT